MRRLLLPVVAVVGLATLMSTATLHLSAPAGRGQGSQMPGLVNSSATGSPLPSRVVYSWGSNDWGQLAIGSSGEGSPTSVPVPGQMNSPTGATFDSVVCGGAHSLGLTSTGQVYAWGANFSGQLGSGDHVEATTPEPVSITGTVVALAAGSSHSLALTSTGQVYAWGANLFGQLGDGTTTGSDRPVAVDLPSGVSVAAIATGGDHSLALTSTGKVYAWGADIYGQLGNGNTDSSTTPVAAQGASGVTFTAIAAGTGHSLALASDGTIYAWGFNASGQLGDGTTADSPVMTPVSVPNGAVFSSIAAGSSHSLALTSTGQVYAWGSNVFGELDSALVGSLPADSTVPVQPLGLPPLTTFVAVAGGLNSSYALTSTGVPWVWGGNAYGQLGVDAPGLDAVLPQALTTLPPGTLATGLFSGPDASAAFLTTRADQSISYPNLPSPTYGDAPVDVAPETNSGLPLTNGASGACAGALVHLQLVAAGTCTLTTTQAGTFWFYPAAITASFEVARAPLTIVADNATATVGAPPATFGYQLAGFKNHDPSSVVSGAAACTSPAGAASLVGDYPITCSPGTLAAGNYDFVAGPAGVLTVLAAASGYAEVAEDGSVWALGPERENSAPAPPFFGSMAGRPLNAPVVGAAFTPRHDGYWLVASDGGIFTFGAAGFEGSMGGFRLNQPIVGVASTPNGNGYWEVASDGGIFSFGDAPFLGSTGGDPLNQPIVGMAATSDGHGYWLVAADGGIFAFGDALYFGSTGGEQIAQPIVGMAVMPSGNGYWITATSGAVFAFGSAPFEGSLRYITLTAPVVGITPTFDGRGYWLASRDGGVFAFGDAGYFGRATAPPVPVDGII